MQKESHTPRPTKVKKFKIRQITPDERMAILKSLRKIGCRRVAFAEIIDMAEPTFSKIINGVQCTTPEIIEGMVSVAGRLRVKDA